MKRLSLSLAALAALSAIAGCSVSSNENLSSSSQEVVNIEESPVKNQAIGNCWLYATGSWVESLHLASTGTTIDVSESYWSYWDWFTTISTGQATAELQTGGSFARAAWLIQSYGFMNEADFVPADATSVTQNIQQTALTAITASLTSGALSTPAARQNPTLVRSELNTAFGLSTTVTADLDATFGADGSRAFGSTTSAATPATTTKVQQASSLTTSYIQDSAGNYQPLTLADFVGTGDATTRSGPYVWQEVPYPADAPSRRQAQIRAQKAMNAGYTVLMSWYVDFNALDGQGNFKAPPSAPGSQGGHMTVLEDYEIANVPGFGTLPAGTVATPDQLAASVDPAATITFLRTKNSWGNYESLAAMPGYFDIYEPYFDGPIQECQTDANESPILSTCAPQTPLSELIVPPGF